MVTYTINSGNGGYATGTGTVFTATIFTLGDYGPDDGTAGVREPRNPVIPPDCLVARKQPDGTWTIPAAISAD